MDTGLATAPPTSPPAAAAEAPQQRDGQGRGWGDAADRCDSPKSASPSAPPSPRTPTPPPLLVDERALAALRARLVDATDGLTVEQLEMVDARCMDAVWRGRGEWDRMVVARAVEEGMREVLEDVEWQRALPDESGMDLEG
jgi:hypothetical protein